MNGIMLIGQGKTGYFSGELYRQCNICQKWFHIDEIAVKTYRCRPCDRIRKNNDNQRRRDTIRKI